MVVKIRKKVKEGPKGYYAVPLALAIACLFGPRRDTRNFRKPIEASQRLRSVLAQYLDLEVLVADRPLSLAELTQWDLKSRPGKLAEMFGRYGVLPMGPAIGNEEERVAILPCIVLARVARLDKLSGFLGKEFPEVTHVAIQNILAPAFELIPGYDNLLCHPPVHIRDLNGALGGLNIMVRDEFEKACLSYSEDLPTLPADTLEGIPIQEPFRPTLR